MSQLNLFQTSERFIPPFKTQLLKWVGNKQRFAHEIVGYFPASFGTYYEPFLGSGAVLGTLAPERGVASDVFAPLIEIWQTLARDPDGLKRWYADRWALIETEGKDQAYETVKKSFNTKPNGADLLFLCRACYGGVVRFRQQDGFMSTPCGVHNPINPSSFSHRVDLWHQRTRQVDFSLSDFETVMEQAKRGDVVYCDPPYNDSQSILYGAQNFSLSRLFKAIEKCKRKGASVVLSLDGTKKSGNKICDLEIPEGLFEREIFVNCGRSMLRRFQMGGKSLEAEVVSDRLLLTY